MRTLSLNLALLLASLFSAPALCAQTSTPLRLQQPLPPRTRSSSSWFQFPDWRRFVFEQLAHHEVAYPLRALYAVSATDARCTISRVCS
eukprot:3612029-Rhodomonas_salina.3